MPLPLLKPDAEVSGTDDEDNEDESPADARANDEEVDDEFDANEHDD